jgi:hypothetical protein
MRLALLVCSINQTRARLVVSKREKEILMSDDNKRNLIFFESLSVRDLYAQMDHWQRENRKRFHSVTVQKDGDSFCCIALTNPTEVIITDSFGGTALVNNRALRVTAI